MKPKIIAYLLVFCAVAQVTVLVSRSRTAGPPAIAPYLLGDTLVRLDGLKVDGSEETLAISTLTGAATVVYAFSSECAHCEDVAPEWASHFGQPSSEGIRRVAITRDRPDLAASYAERFGWSVPILSMPDMTATDRRYFLLSRTPWLYVFDHDGTLQFQGHGSALDRMGEIVASLAHPATVAREAPASETGGS
jgi:peroxiredoxin